MEGPFLLLLLVLFGVANCANTTNGTANATAPVPSASPVPAIIPPNSTLNDTNSTEPVEPPDPSVPVTLVCSDAAVKAKRMNVRDIVPVCLRIYANTNLTGSGTWKKAVFFPYVDDFSLLEVPNNTAPAPGRFPMDTTSFNNRPVLYVECGGVISPPKVISNMAGSVMITEAYLIVFLKDGLVSSMFWDPNPCEDNGCGPKTPAKSFLCVDNNQCGISTSELCVTSDAACTLKVYLTWIGTDGKRDPLKSAQVRLSNWKQYSFASASGFLLEAAKNSGALSTPTPSVTATPDPTLDPGNGTAGNGTAPIRRYSAHAAQAISEDEAENQELYGQGGAWGSDFNSYQGYDPNGDPILYEDYSELAALLPEVRKVKVRRASLDPLGAYAVDRSSRDSYHFAVDFQTPLELMEDDQRERWERQAEWDTCVRAKEEAGEAAAGCGENKDHAEWERLNSMTALEWLTGLVMGLLGLRG
jgi:hypothetical protein